MVGRAHRPGWNPFAGISNIAGQRAAAVPIGFADGLPVGLQVIGRHVGDGTVLAVAVAGIVEQVGALDESGLGSPTHPLAFLSTVGAAATVA